MPAEQAAAQARSLYGTLQPVPPVQHLDAGGWTCEWRDGELRNLRWQGVEVVRGLAYLLRDRNWGTVPATVSALQLASDEQGFDARFRLQMATAEGLLRCEARIRGVAKGQQGRLSFEVQATADAPMWTNRCGFVVLHPAAAAGCALEVEHTDGRCEQTVFPVEISPSQPVFDIRALRYEPADGLAMALTLEAELPGDPAGKFEMEDQRNWSDASFKTYVASLLDPWPYALPAGQVLTQRVSVQVTGRADAASADDARPVPLSLGQPGAARMPAIGVGVPMGLGSALPQERAALQALGAAWWIAELDLRQPAAALDQLKALAACRAGRTVAVQLDVIAPDDQTPPQAAALAAELCAAAALRPEALRLLPAALLQSFQPSDRWPEVASLEDCAAALRQAFPTAQVGGGLYTSFTELNRKRPQAQGLDFIGHLTCPIVHAPDDASVMQTLEALPHIVRSVRALWPGLAYRLGPSTLAPRRNPYGQGTVPNPQGERVALADRDPRHGAAFGAAWVAGYAATVADAGLDVLALLDSHGANGPFPTGASASSDRPCPAWQALAVLAGAGGARIVPVVGLTDCLRGLAWVGSDGETQSVLVNLVDRPVRVAWADRPGQVTEVGPYGGAMRAAVSAPWAGPTTS